MLHHYYGGSISYYTSYIGTHTYHGFPMHLNTEQHTWVPYNTAIS